MQNSRTQAGNVQQQRLIESSDPNLLKSFKASQQLHQSLTKNYKRQDSNSVSKGTIFAMTGKDIVKQARLEKEIAALQGSANKNQISLESEIAALSNYSEPQSREQTKLLIAKQKESRRDRHIHSNKEFEKWETRLTKNLDEAYKDIKRDVIGFFEESDLKINEYYSSLTDTALVGCEIDFLDELNKIISEHKIEREQKVSNLGERLEELEQDRQKSLSFFCDKLEANLIDIAFVLAPEVIELVKIHRDQFRDLIGDQRQMNTVYVEEVNNRQVDTFIRYEEMRRQSEQKWRDLKHNLYVKQFLQDIKQMSFVNPPQRVRLYETFKESQMKIYRDRIHLIERLSGIDISVLSKAVLDKWIDETKQYNDQASQKIDENFDSLVKESERTNSLAMERYQLLSQGLYYAGAKDQESLRVELETDYLPIVQSLFESARELMKAAVKHVEEADLKQTDVSNNFGQFYLKVAIKNDEYKRDVTLMKLQYEIEKANAADKNDENIEHLNGQFGQLKVRLSQALHHPKLQSTLEESFLKLDELESEYRTYHELNLTIAKGHPAIIQKQHEVFERTVASLFSLVGEDQREHLDMIRMKRVEVNIKKIMAKEEYYKRIEEEKVVEEAKSKKGGKAPTAKPKDPKKVAQEQDDRFKELMKQKGGVDKVKEIMSQLGLSYLEQLSTQEIVEKMYVSQDQQDQMIEDEKKRKEKQLHDEQQLLLQKVDPKAKVPVVVAPPMDLPEYNPELDVPPVSVDCKKASPHDPQGNAVLANDVVFETQFLVRLITQTQSRVLDYIKHVLDGSQDESKRIDKEFIEGSVNQLDDKLKKHYPQKGKTEVDVFQVRSAQITQHKKRYERHAKSTLEKLELQTEQFNFHLESGLMDMKEYEKDQKKLKLSLQSANTLAKFQGIQNTVKENYFKFGESNKNTQLFQEISEVQGKLSQLQGLDLDQVASKNVAFIKESKLFEQGGNYSPEEVEWYVDMMKELNNQVTRSKEQRQSKIDELNKISLLKKQEYLDSFEKEYAISVEELAAKDGTGTKYGRPKRLAQERLRTEMTKCEKAQEAINLRLQQLNGMYDEYTKQKSNLTYFATQATSFTLKLRRLMMGLMTCIKRYAIHIEARKLDAKVQDMPRITYHEGKFDTLLDQEHFELDKKNIEDDLESMGVLQKPLYFQKDQKKFIEWVNEIEKVIKDEAQKTYAGDKAKYLNGVDKIPDYLRSYIENMRRNMDDFRIQSIRDLRNSCDEFSEFVPKINEIMFGAIDIKYNYKLQTTTDIMLQEFNKKRTSMETIKELHQTKLKPNLSNPRCKTELDDLCQAEKLRLQGWIEELKSSQSRMLVQQFQDGIDFFKCTQQNFEFTLLYYDCIVLFEDFVKLPGDEQIQKKHQNIKQSLRQKQSGQVFDTSSERSLMKEWQGFPIDSFNMEELKVVYSWNPNLPVMVETKDPKAKKDDKKPAPAKPIEKKGGKEVPESDQLATHTKSLKSFKTYRQKSAYHHYHHGFEEFQAKYCKQVADTQSLFKMYLEREMKFEFKWEQNVVSLFAST